MPAACGRSEHMSSLSGDNGEAEGSCPEPAGRWAVLCQPHCNSPFQGGSHFSIRTVLRAARLGHYHNGVTWEAGNRQGRGLLGRTNWLLSHYLAQRDRQSQWLEKKRLRTGPCHGRAERTSCLLGLGDCECAAQCQPHTFRSSFSNLQLCWALACGCPSARAPGPQCWRTLQAQTLWLHFVPKPQYFTLKSFLTLPRRRGKQGPSLGKEGKFHHPGTTGTSPRAFLPLTLNHTGIFKGCSLFSITSRALRCWRKAWD